jgi:hypothetical protein
MGDVIKFPKQWQNGDIDYSGLELFVDSCWKFFDTFPVERRAVARTEFGQMIEGLLRFIDACKAARRN